MRYDQLSIDTDVALRERDSHLSVRSDPAANTCLFAKQCSGSPLLYCRFSGSLPLHGVTLTFPEQVLGHELDDRNRAAMSCKKEARLLDSQACTCNSREKSDGKQG
jgi:hypothetical protein